MATIFALVIYVALCVGIACDEFSGHNYDFHATFMEKVKDAICSWFGELRDVALNLWAIPFIGLFIDGCIALAPLYVPYIEKFYHLFF